MRQSAAIGPAFFDRGALMTVDPDGRIVMADHHAEAMLGYTWDELATAPLDQVLTADDDQHSPLAVGNLVGRQVDVCCRRKDGSSFSTDTSFTEVDGVDGPLVAIAVRAPDPQATTTGHPDGEKYRLLLDATALAIVGVDGTGQIVMTNREADCLFGYGSGDLVGSPIEILVPDRIRGTHLAHRNGYLRSPRTRPMGEGIALSARRKDGTEFPAEISLSALHTRDGVLVAATVHDISARQAAERERERMQAELDRARRLESIGRLAAGISHDFNNTLSIVLGQTEVLIDELADGADLRDPPTRALFAEGMTRVHGAAQRAARLTQDLLAFGQRQTLRPEAFELDHVLTEATRILGRTLGGQVTVVNRLAAPGRYVLADRAKLEQVLFNLVINARDAMPGGGTITISTYDVEVPARAGEELGIPPGRYLRLDVADDGEGIPADVLEHVLEPFFTTKPEGEGTGLGLATVHGMIQQAGGCLRLASTVGIGTTVSLYLPEHAF